MSRQGSSVWVIAEQNRGQVLGVSLELIGKARKIADELGVLVEAVLLGNEISDQAEMLLFSGADAVYLGDSPDFEVYQPEIYTERIVSLAKEVQPQIILMGSTYVGRELAPLIAAKLETGLTAHCINLVLNENQVLEQQIPAYGGMMSIICPDKRPQMATIAQGVHPLPELDNHRSGKIVPVEPLEGVNIRIETLEVIYQEPEGVPLESSPVVVAGGAGAGSIEGWQEIEALAETLNAALGSTRPAVDEGWTDLETMIGQSGKMVSPELYIGVGLSGELQHMVGIVGAKVMIAINNDSKAHVFEQVDYGVVEDCRVFVPALVKALKNHEAYARRATHVT